MGGTISSVGKFFGSDAGRVLAGVATGGVSEIGRVASRTAAKHGADPLVASGVGLLAGSGASTAAQSLGVVTPATTNLAPGVTSGGVTASTAPREPDPLAPLPVPDAPILPKAQDPYDYDESRRRAISASEKLGGGRKRRASQTLTDPGNLLSGGLAGSYGP